MNQCSESSAAYLDEKQKYETMIKRAVQPHERVTMIDLSSHFCDAQTCNMARDGELYYRDKNHLNAIGSRYVGEKIVDLIAIE